MEKYLSTLKRCPLFFGIDDSELVQMLSCLDAKIKAFNKRETVMSEGSCAELIGIVLSGSVQIIQVDYFGNRNLIGESGEGDIFAEDFACSQAEDLPVSIVSNEESEIMLVDCHRVLHTCSNNCTFHQSLIFNLMRDLAEKTILYHQKIEITSKRTTRDKLMTYLMLQAKRVGSESFDIPFDRQELADFLEVDRSGLSTEISKLKKESIIENRKNHFVLLQHT